MHTKENVDLWRKSYDTPPPSLSEKDYRNPRNDVKYASIPWNALPTVETMKDTESRIVPFWHNTIARNVFDSKKVLVVAHKNSLRAIFKHL